MDTTPVSLLEQLKKPRQQAAWERFAELYTPLLYYWARSQGLAEADAADLVQEVFVILINKLPSFRYDRDGSFRSWLHTVTLNKHRELRRKRTPRPMDDLDQQPDKNGASSLDEKEYRLHLIRQMLPILKPQLPPSTWQLFERYVIAGQPPQAVAKAHQVTLGTVYAAKSLVLRRLREELRGLLE